MKFLSLIFALFIIITISAQKKVDGKYDESSNMFLQTNPIYWISEYKDGVAKISKGGFTGIISKNGSIIIPIIYDDVFISNNLLYAKINSEKLVFDLDGTSNCNTFYGINATNDSYQKYPEYSIFGVDYYGKPFAEGFFVSKTEYNSETNKYQLTYFDEFGNVKISTNKYEIGYAFKNGLASVSKFRYYGFIDKKGAEIIMPKYDYPSKFQEGVANVSKNDKYGLIDVYENTIIPFEYDLISPASEGVVYAKKDNTYSYFDIKGQPIFKVKFDQASNFTNGYANVQKDGKNYSINRKGEISNDYQFAFDDGYRFMNYGDARVYENKLGTVIFNNTFDALYYYEGLSTVKINGKYGFIDRLGKIIIKPIYDSAKKFEDGVARVTLNNDNFYINKRGERTEYFKALENLNFNFKGLNFWKNEDGTFEIKNCASQKPILKNIQSINIQNNFIIIKKDGKKGIYNFDGKNIIKDLYDDIIIKKNKIIGKLNKEIFFLDETFNLIKKEKIDGEDFFLTNEPKSTTAVLIYQDKKVGFINSNNNRLISPRFESVKFLDKSGLFTGKYLDADYMIDVDKNIATLWQYPDYEEYAKGLLTNKKYGDKQGLINSEGKIVLPLEYQFSKFLHGVTIIKKNNLFGLIDENGIVLIEPKYQLIASSDNSSILGNDELILIKLDNRFGFVNRKGNIVIDLIYEDAIPFNNKLAPVKINSKWGYIDKFNTIIITPTFDEAWPFFDEYQARVKLDNKYFIINRYMEK